MLTPLPLQGWKQKPGCAQRPFFGVQPVLLNPSSKEPEEIEGPGEGLLAIKAPWPSALRGIHGDPTRFMDTYFSMPGLVCLLFSSHSPHVSDCHI